MNPSHRKWPLVGPALTACLLVGLWSCGFADSGDGTNTVGVYGTMRCAYPVLQTFVTYKLTDGSGPLIGANVTLIDADSHENIEVPETEEAGTYVAEWPGYHRRIKAHIWRGKDGLRFQMEGPSPHIVSRPAPGTILAPNARLEVRWTAPDGIRSDRVDVHVDAEDGEPGAPLAQTAGGTLLRDCGKARLLLQDVEPGAHGLMVSRTTTMSPTGARRGAHVEHTYAVETTFHRR